MSQEKSWQARISETTDALAASFVESISYDRRLYKQDIAGSIAHATMLAKVGLITDADRDAIVAGLKGIEADIEKGDFHFDESLEDIHMVIEAELTRRIGEPARRLHTGRSRNDQVAFDLRTWIGEAANSVNLKLDDIQRAFVELAIRSVNVVMPSYTHLQRAQPISAAAEALAWAEMFLRDSWLAVLHIRREVTNFFPLGAGAAAGSSLPLDVERTWVEFGALQAREEAEKAGKKFNRAAYESHLMGFGQLAGPRLGNSLDATASRDLALDFTYALARISMHLSRWAEQWIIYMTTEFSFIRIADRYTTGSSMMPQKRNPDMLELIRGRCGNVYGDLFALLTILKGLPIGYNRDLQEDKRIVFRAYDTVSSCLTMAAAIVSSASFVKENIEPTLERGFLDATSLAEYLVTQGVAFRTAHHIVGTLVSQCEKQGKSALSQLSVDEFNAVVKAHDVPVTLTKDVYSALGARNVVGRYKSPGAAGGEPLKKQLEEWKKRLGIEG